MLGRRETPFHQERPALFVASPNHNPKLPILSISYLSRFPLPRFPLPAFPYLDVYANVFGLKGV